MPETNQEIRYRWIKPILEDSLTIKALAEICPFSERTIKYWLASYRKEGLAGLNDKSTRPHTSPNKTPDWIRDRILKIREDYKLGGKKITWQLEKEGITISESTVNRLLRKAGKTRKYRKRRKNIYKKEKITKPGKMIEIDIKYGIHFGFGRWWYQYTAIDVASRWRFLQGFEYRGNKISLGFLNNLVERSEALFPIEAVKTDNDSVFTNRLTGYSRSKDPMNPRLHPFDLLCEDLGIVHYLIDPGKPSQNGYVERSHRSDKEYFYSGLKRPGSIEEYNYRLRLWNNWYNDLPHCGLNGLSPNEYLKKVQNVLS